MVACLGYYPSVNIFKGQPDQTVPGGKVLISHVLKCICPSMFMFVSIDISQ